VAILSAQLGAGTPEALAVIERLRQRVAAQRANAIWWAVYVNPVAHRAPLPVLGAPSGPPGGLLLPPGWYYWGE
jgi:hypothetical protein